MRNSRFVLHASLLLAVVLGLAACKDHDDDDGPVTPPQTLGDTVIITSGPRVLSFNRASPGTATSAQPVTGLASGERLVGADYRPADGKLYAVLTGSGGSRVAQLDPLTGALSSPVTLSVALDAAATDFGVDFNPVPDRLRVVSNTGQNLRINVADGVTTADGTLKLDRRTATTTDIVGITGVAYSNSFKEACRTTIYYLNSASGMLLTSADPNAGTVFNVGALGVAAVAMNGFEVVTTTAADGLPVNSGLAVLSTGGGAPTLYGINLGSGATTPVGAIGGLAAGEQLLALSAGITSSPTKQARGELGALTASNKLATFNRGSPAKLCTGPTAITGLNSGENLLGIDTRPATSELYGLTDGSRLVVIDPATGAATERSVLSTALPAGQSGFGVDFNPVPDRLRVVAGNGVNLRIDPRAATTPNVTTDTALSGTSSANVTAVAYTNSLQGAAENTSTGASTTLFGVDTTRDMLVRLGGDPANSTAGDPGNPNAGVVVDIGALGADVEAVNGLEIDGVNGQALLAGGAAGDTTAKLYSVDLATGAATLVTGAAASSTIGGGETVRGLVLLPPAQAVTVFALLEDGLSLVSFAPSAAATPSAPVTITGLAGGETIVDWDFRVTGNAQRNRQLVGLSSANRLYTIDPVTGVASNGRALKDAGGADVVVSGSTALDFNPVPDLLRIISSSGQNLRINADSAVTSTDTAISGATTGLMGAGYANSFVTLSPRTATTALFAIDAAGASLVLVGANPATGGACPGDAGNPNCGVVTLVGVLGAAAPAPLSLLGDMDIVGGRNGYALAAVQVAGGGTSTLVRINLASGVATGLGTIVTGGPAVRSIALRVQAAN